MKKINIDNNTYMIININNDYVDNLCIVIYIIIITCITV